MSQTLSHRLLYSQSASPAKSELSKQGDGMKPNLMSLLSKGFQEGGEAPLPSRRWVIVLAIACLVAICSSGYLAWVAFTSSKVAGCGGGSLFNCGHVISSRWSLWLGIPVSMMAVGLYLTMAVALFFGASSRFGNTTRQFGWALVTVLAISAGLAGVWFISLQIFVVKHLCSYCLVAHCCGLIAAAVVLWRRPSGLRGIAIVSLSFVGVAFLIGGQLLAEEPKTYRIEKFEPPAATGNPSEFEAPEFDAPVFDAPIFDAPAPAPEKPTALIESPTSGLKAVVAAVLNPTFVLAAKLTTTLAQETQEGKTEGQATAQAKPAQAKTEKPVAVRERRFVPVNGGTIKLDVAAWPLSGSQSAKYIYAEMFDYACPHCRRTHEGIKKASELLKGDMAVVVLPVPLNAACNGTVKVTNPKFVESCELSKLAVAVWRVDPAKFTEFHNWMFSTEDVPTYAAAKAHADKLVTADKLNPVIASGVPAQYIAKTVELYRRAGAGNVPKLIFPTTTVVGEFTSGEGLVDIIKQQIK
ncbi:MAG: vitamin K epoxide reductase family protein [Mariniblastus sp.]